MKSFQVGPDEKEDKILLAKVDGKIYAVGSKCSHFGLPLEAGLLFDDKVYCPFHFASFSVKTGVHEFGPTFQGIPTYKVTVENDRVLVEVPKSIKVHKIDYESHQQKNLLKD